MQVSPANHSQALLRVLRADGEKAAVFEFPGADGRATLERFRAQISEYVHNFDCCIPYSHMLQTVFPRKKHNTPCSPIIEQYAALLFSYHTTCTVH